MTTVPMALKYLLPGQMNYMSEHGFEVLMISADGKERLEVIDSENCPHIIVPLTRKITPVADLKCLLLLIKIFKKEKPDIVHTHTPKAGLLGMMAAKIAGVKIRIHTVAGLPMMVENGFKFLLLKNVERLTYRCATQVWPNSSSLLKYIGEQKICPSKKIKVISKGSSNGIDLKRFDKNNLDPEILQNVKNSIQYNSDNFYLLTIGRLVKDKGIPELTMAFTKLKNKGNFKKIKFILVGKFEEDLDPLPENILTEIISNKDIIHIEWTPFVEYYISIANLFVFPSHREGFPNVLLQSGALKLPILCSEIPGNVDVIENNVTGRLFPVNDVTAITENIEFAIRQPSKMEMMSQVLYDKVRTFYKTENIWDAIHKEYNNLQAFQLHQENNLQENKKLIRITTVPMALAYPLRGQPSYMQNMGLDVTMISADGKELSMLLAAENVSHIIVPMTRSITPFKDLACIFKLVKIFKKLRPNIVHTETPKAGLVGMIAAKIANVKVRIQTVAGLPLMVEKGVKLKVLEAVEKITYAAATNVWPNSNSLKNFILQHKFTTASKINIVGLGSSNGVDTVRFNKNNLDQKIIKEIKNSLKFEHNNIYLLFIGRLVFDKGIVELVNVFIELQKDNPLLKLVLAGQYEPHLDPLPMHIEQEILNNQNIIHIQWTDKVEYYMSIANYFVFPSYREGFPNVLLESAAMELPIICSRIAGNVDIVTDNETGLIFESMNETSLKVKLLQALADPDKMKLMAHKLHAIITSSYKRELFWEAMKHEYDLLLNK